MNRISRFAEGVMEACWLIALIVSPLFFNVYSSRVFEPDKIALVRSLAVIALVAWLIKLISEGGPRFDHLNREQFRPAQWRQVPFLIPVAALTVIYVISTLLSVAPNISIWGSYQRMQGFYSTISYIILFTVLAANLRRRAQIERIFTVVAVTSLPMATYGILQRYRLDPLPWGGDTIERVTGNAGNAIFLAAYLIMASMIVLSRVVTAFRAVMTGTGSLVLPTLRAAIYIFIFALNLVAIWFTQSRGPQLGLLAGLFFFFVLMALHYRVRWLVLTTVGLGVAAGAFLVVLNLPNTPLASLAQTRGFDRLAKVFDEIQGRTGTGQVRVLIWTGVVQMMTPHEPLEYPDGSKDIWNPIRPLVGYGPEAMLIAYNRFYPPDLGKLEARNASPDRSHNETFDALAFTGVLGLLAQFGLFVSLFYYSLKWLGLINSALRRNIFLLLVLGGGLASTIFFVQWQGPQFFGVSLPLGLILGLIAFLAIYAVIPDHGDTPKMDSWRAIAIIGLFSAIVAHFVEIHFGIAIASTRTHFWVFLGALLVLGWIWPIAFAAEAPATEPKPSMPAPTPAGTGKNTQRGGRRRAAEAGARSIFSKPVYITTSVLLLIFLTLGYNFITNGTREASAFAAVWSSLTMRPGVGDSLAVLGLMLLTWLMGGALFYMEEAPETANREWVQGLFASLGFVLLGASLMWVILASLLVIASSQPTSVDDLTRLVGLLNAYYFFAL
ncbi:MAG: O-antigen ligase family protein, partial [Anaerolineales bacterium]|nr:O-antigen ligase family protein [Anaerolineales bacterium]